MVRMPHDLDVLRPRRRLLICTDLDPRSARQAGAVSALAVEALQRRGWDCVIVGPACPRAPGGVPDVGATGDPCERVALPSTASPWDGMRLVRPAFRRMADAFARVRPTLVLCESELVVGHMGQAIAARRGVPVVSSFLARPADALPRLRRIVGQFASGVERFHRNSARVFAASEAARARLREHGVAESDLWGRAVDAERFAPRWRSLSTRRAFGWDGRYVFIHAGRLAAGEQVDVVMDAYQRAASLMPAGAIGLALLGTGPDERRLRRAAPRDVTFLGMPEPRRALPALYASADAFVSASRSAASAPWVLEAMASGLPPVVAGGGAAAEMVRGGTDGLVVAAGDLSGLAHVMVKLARTVPLHRRLSEAARSAAVRLGWEPEMERLDAGYAEVASMSRRGATANALRPRVALGTSAGR